MRDVFCSALFRLARAVLLALARHGSELSGPQFRATGRRRGSSTRFVRMHMAAAEYWVQSKRDVFDPLYAVMARRLLPRYARLIRVSMVLREDSIIRSSSSCAPMQVCYLAWRRGS
eukprot:6197839-Pleurochrysis_carterae.AAC.3